MYRIGSCNILGNSKDYCCYSLNNVGDLKLLTGTVYIYIWTDPITLHCSLARAGKNTNYIIIKIYINLL